MAYPNLAGNSGMVEGVMLLPRYGPLPTERPNPRSRSLDSLAPVEIVSLMNREDRGVAVAVGRVGREIARAVTLVAGALQSGGRLFFVGAGTSGRLGGLEAGGGPPAVSTPPPLAPAVLAGGSGASAGGGGGGGVGGGIAAGGVTPFVRAALAEARRRRGRTVLVAMDRRSPLGRLADVVIAPRVGAEGPAGAP